MPPQAAVLERRHAVRKSAGTTSKSPTLPSLLTWPSRGRAQIEPAGQRMFQLAYVALRTRAPRLPSPHTALSNASRPCRCSTASGVPRNGLEEVADPSPEWRPRIAAGSPAAPRKHASSPLTPRCRRALKMDAKLRAAAERRPGPRVSLYYPLLLANVLNLALVFLGRAETNFARTIRIGTNPAQPHTFHTPCCAQLSRLFSDHARNRRLAAFFNGRPRHPGRPLQFQIDKRLQCVPGNRTPNRAPVYKQRWRLLNL